MVYSTPCISQEKALLIVKPLKVFSLVFENDQFTFHRLSQQPVLLGSPFLKLLRGASYKYGQENVNILVGL